MPETKRIQRLRTRGWKMPENCVYVGRPTKFGNPFTIKSMYDLTGDPIEANRLCVIAYKEWIEEGRRSRFWFHSGSRQHNWILNHMHSLNSKDLACYCHLDVPCHADVLLELSRNKDWL